MCHRLGGNFRIRMAIESLGVDGNLPKLVEEDKSHKEVSILLTTDSPGVDGFSERSVRRFCAKHNFHVRDRSLLTADLDAVVSSAVGNIYLKISIELVSRRIDKFFHLMIFFISPTLNIFCQINP